MFVVAENKRAVHPGQRFTSLVVQGATFWLPEKSRPRVHRQYAVCLCDCGNFDIVSATLLLRSGKKSCGCLTGCGQCSHRMTGTRLYRTWRHVLERCESPNCQDYRRYGARGISVCKEWHAFEPFRDWAMSNGYSDELSIERIENNGNYEPSNCRWATWVEQCNNRRNSRMITAFGETKSLANWGRDQRCTVATSTMLSRIDKLGWTPEIAMTQPTKSSNVA